MDEKTLLIFSPESLYKTCKWTVLAAELLVCGISVVNFTETSTESVIFMALVYIYVGFENLSPDHSLYDFIISGDFHSLVILGKDTRK